MGEAIVRDAMDLGLPFQDMSPLVDEMVGFLVVASVAGREAIDLVNEALVVYDDVILPLIKARLDEAALYHIDYTGVDAFELIDCLGGDAIAGSLSWALNVLSENAAGEPPEEVVHLFGCLGIDKQLLDMSDDVAASAIVYAFTAAINRMLTNLIDTIQ
ncbi:MAG: hypothetical protein F7C35_00600 [Desulfurococcales archaeon]|nr:hypothetical protein [Desulfurococcales archaeon]